jgi:EAL domain-containing protein (putative c-di-GMP-specific phosphodiesterase class I)/GGDEF domain-containing protein
VQRASLVRFWVRMMRSKQGGRAAARSAHATALPFGREGLANALRHQLGLVPRCGVIVLHCVGLAELSEALGSQGRALLLSDVGQTLRECVGEPDLVVGCGDGRFGILMPGRNDIGAMAEFALRLVAATSEPRFILDREIVMHSVAGVAPVDDNDVDAGIDHATLACREARRFGLGQVVMYTAQLAFEAHQRLQLTSGVGFAAARQELHVVYQAINDLVTGDIVGEEALVRWTHPELGLVAPNDFIPIAEESRAIVSIGRWVLEQACDRMVTLADQFTVAPKMHVNVSARQLEDLTFPSTVRDILAARSLDPGMLTLELTETGVIDDTDRTKEALDALKAVGVRLAIDDFGVGYSSLSYLSRLPVDAVKIDRAFIAGLGTASADGEVVRMITQAAIRMNLDVVAEGIETEQQRDEVVRLGCVLGQGFLFGQPQRVGGNAGESVPQAAT